LSTVFDFALIGVCLGALYSLIGLGIVIVYRGSGIINFSSGSTAMATAYIFWYLHGEHSLSFAQAFVIAMAFCAVYGVLVQVLIMRPLRNHSLLARMLATLGLVLTTDAIVSHIFPQPSEVLNSSLPTAPVSILGVSLGEDKVAIFVIVTVATVLLAAVYKYSRFGLISSAIVDNSVAAETLGHSTNNVAAINWAIGSMLAGMAGILLGPITGLSPTGMILFVIPALAAAAVGNLSSIPFAYLGGLILGIGQSEVTRYVTSLGWTDAVPFVMIVLLFMIRGRTLPPRGEPGIRLPSVGSGRLRPKTILALGAIALTLIEILNPSWVAGVELTLIVGVLLLSIVVVTGYAGQISLAQYTVAGLAAMIAADMSVHFHLPFELALLAGMLSGIPIGLLVGAPALRSRGSNLAIITLALALAVGSVIFQNPSYTGPTDSVATGSTELFGLDVSNVLHERRYAVLCLIVFILVGVVVANLRRGRIGRRLLAIRSNERAAASLGLNIWGLKLFAFSLASVIASLSGVLLAWQNTVLVPSQFDPITSITLLGEAVIGGVGFVAGPAFGASLYPGALGSNIGQLFGAQIQDDLELAAGVILILLLIFHQDGIANVAASQARRVQALVWRPKGTRVRSVVTEASDAAEFTPAIAATGNQATETSPRRGLASASGDTLVPIVRRVPSSKELVIQDLSVSFGGVQALKNVSLQVRPGRITGLIGPNGAGKSTFIDAVTGYAKPRTGSVRLGDTLLNPLTPRQRALQGLGRSFQHLELFEGLTVRENLLVAGDQVRWISYIRDLAGRSRDALSPAASSAVERFSLQDDLDHYPSELGYGKRRLVAIARTLAAKSAVVLLDEPAAGLGEDDAAKLIGLLRHWAADSDVGVLLVDHNVELVMGASERIVALEFGAVICDGTPEEVRSNPEVVRAYLGAGGTEEKPAVGLAGPSLSGDGAVE
jgi:ABC-type branched-subunit amino acid transport system ATPase component/ABC-type branched-subunit amino acid transport system permease subunit